MSDPLLPPDPTPTPAPASAAKKIRCEFCGCQLVTSGEVLEMGEKARSYRDMSEHLTNARADLARVNERIRELETQLATALAPPAPAAQSAEW